MDKEILREILVRGCAIELENLKKLIPLFPHGVDKIFKGHSNYHWIVEIIPIASVKTILWAMKEGVSLSFSEEGECVLQETMYERKSDDRYEILTVFLENGAPTDTRGINDYTPLHVAASLNDTRALELLLRFGADLNARTRIDEKTTPLEEARNLNNSDAARLLLKYTPVPAGKNAGHAVRQEKLAKP